MTDSFSNADGKMILIAMAAAVQKNKAYLGDIDGLIGDGDHGANMNKGFSIFRERFWDKEIGFADGLDKLGSILFSEIGGSMGPIYGTLFCDMSGVGASCERIGVAELAAMLEAGQNGVYDIVEARPGDKTLADTLAPAVLALKGAAARGEGLAQALADMKAAAKTGADSTKDLISKFGRSARLGERSRGVPDAGATSCYLILEAMADAILDLAHYE